MYDTVTLTLDNDEELVCAILTFFEVGERTYIALLPMHDGEISEDGDVYLYRFIDNGEDQEPELENIEDDEEFLLASEAFEQWVEEQEFGDIDLDELEDMEDFE